MRFGLIRVMNQIAWDLFFVAKGDSSQYGEEALIISTVNHFGSKTYLEIGAHQPIKCSNSWKLYKKGWRGLCIDPQENFKINWKIFRPRDIFLTVAISPIESDFVRFFDFERRVNLVSTIDPVFAEEWIANGFECSERLVPALTPKQVLEKFQLEFKCEPDLIMIDVEGMDYLLLEEFLKIIKSTRWILFEDHKKIPLDFLSPDFAVSGRAGPSVLVSRLPNHTSDRD